MRNPKRNACQSRQRGDHTAIEIHVSVYGIVWTKALHKFQELQPEAHRVAMLSTAHNAHSECTQFIVISALFVIEHHHVADGGVAVGSSQDVDKPCFGSGAVHLRDDLKNSDRASSLITCTFCKQCRRIGCA